MDHHFIFGCGFLGRVLARQWVAAGQSVWTTSRDPEKIALLQAEGIHAVQADHGAWADFAQHQTWPVFRSITVCIGNDRRQGSDHQLIYQAATRAALLLAQRGQPDVANATASALATTHVSTRVLFVSTTGVYQTDSTETGAIPRVDENWPVAAYRDGAAASLACEALLAGQTRVPYTIFRLAGIYSLQRIPNLSRLQSGQPIAGSGQGLLNLIHVVDAATILRQAALDPPAWPVLNVADGHPIRRQAFYDHLAQRYQCPAPQFTEEGGRTAGQKQIDTTRLQVWFRGPWQFPDYRLGLEDA